MNVLVIGGAGYIGSHVCLELMQSNNVIVFDNLSSGFKENLFNENKFVKGDILNIDDLEKVFLKETIDAVIHLAAFKSAGESMFFPQKYSTNNITGTINILNAMIKHNVSNFIFSSSAAVYGNYKYLPIDEKHFKNPQNYYGFTKLEIERIAKWYDKLKGIKYSMLRYFNACGYDKLKRISCIEKNPTNLIPVVMEAACKMRDKIVIFGDDYKTKDGTCCRDYIHVSDLALAHFKALEYTVKNKTSSVFNLGTGNFYSVLEVINKTKEITGTNFKVEIGPKRKGDPDILYSDVKKASEVLNWSAKNSDLHKIISSTWNVYKNNN